MEGFLSHRSTKVSLPERGMVVITGPNGAGKSTFAEAVSVACWGKTLRGTDPWRSGEAGRVRCVSDLGTSGRSTTAKGTRSTEWVADPSAPLRLFDTATKTKDAALQVLGDHDTWRRTHVFSSADADNFTTATDATRKELLEEMLHLSCFDQAWQRCRADRGAAKTELEEAETSLAKAVAARRQAESGIQALESTPPEPQPVAPSPYDPAEHPPLEEAARTLAEGAREARQRLLEAATRARPAELTRAATLAEGALKAAEAHLRAVSKGSCSACGQDIGAAHLRDAEDRVAEAKAASEAAEQALRQAQVEGQRAYDAAATRSQDADREASLAQMALVEAGGRRRAWEGHKVALAAWSARQAQRASQQADLEEAWQEADDQAFEREAVVAAARTRLAELDVVSEVLGLRGVRAHVLGSALGGIEAVANIYLQRIAQKPMRLQLKAYTETKSGTVQDKISLEVEGAGGGHGYKASSGGERRRIDSALLLALAEVSSAAAGRSPGTLFFDEVFDALDADGVDAVVDALSELALDRAIVVITHSEALAARIPAVQRLVVREGAVIA